MVQQIITFDGGLSTKLQPHLIGRNEGIICENVNLEKGSLYPLPELILTDAGANSDGNIDGKHIYYENGTIVSSEAETDDRFYDTYGGRLYWSNNTYSTYGLMRYNDTDTGVEAEAPAAPDAAPTAGTHTSGQIAGDYVYCYTFVDSDGIESAPSDFLDITATDNSLVINFADTNSVAEDAQYRYVYRTGGDNPTFNLVGEVAIATTTFTDNTRDIDVSRIELYTFDNTPPVDDLDMLVECNGTMWGSYNKKVYFSRTGSPEFWGVLDYITLDKECTGIGKFGDAVIAFTRTSAYLITGSTRDNVNIERMPFNQGCVNKHSIVNIDAYLVWTSLNGICMFNGSTINVLTKETLGWDEFDRVGNLTYADFDNTNQIWDGSAGFNILYAVGWQDKYFGVYTNGIIIMDLSDGLKLSTVSVTGVVSLGLNREDNILYVVVANSDGSTYDVYYLPDNNTNMSATWKTGRLADETTDITKHYRYVELDNTPESIEVFIDGKSIKKYINKKQFKLPSGCFGKDIQFEIITNKEIRSLKYEYSHLKASR